MISKFFQGIVNSLSRKDKDKSDQLNKEDNNKSDDDEDEEEESDEDDKS